MAHEMAAFADYIGDLTSRQETFSSMAAVTVEEKKTLFKAMNDPTGRISDLINRTVTVTDIYAEIVTLAQKDEKGNYKTDANGEIIERTMPRIVLICKDGSSYQCVSMGIYNSIRKLIAIFGPPTWKEGIDLTVKQIEIKQGRLFTLELA